MTKSIKNNGVTQDTLLENAKEFLIAAEVILNHYKNNISMPIYFLFARSIELSLKSFLASRGAKESQLKNIGHDIYKLFLEAKKKGLGDIVIFDDCEVGAMQVLNINYRSKGFEYPGEEMIFYYSYVEVMESVARKLVHALSGVGVAEKNDWDRFLVFQ